MKAVKLLTLTAFIFLCGPIYSDGFGLEYEGEIRTREAYENNYDLDYDTDDGSLVADARAKIEFTVTTPIPLYMYSKIQLGNIASDEQLFDTQNFLENIRLEARELYFGWEAPDIEIKAGLVNTDSPSDVVIDGENAGVKIKADFDAFEVKSFYCMTNLVDGYFNFIDTAADLNHLLFIGAESDQYFDSDLNLWMMYLNGNDVDNYIYNPVWTGVKLENQNAFFDIESRFIYNGGSLYLSSLDSEVPISAFYTYTEISVEPVPDASLFTRFNLASSLSYDTATVNQFQVINGEGSLDTDLGLLFGGSPYGSESYFSSENVSTVKDNLSSGSMILDEPGLFIYEFGFSQDFNFLPFSSELVIGGANTCSIFTGDGYFSSLIGLEADLHNKMKITDELDFFLSMCLLFPGSAFEECYTVNNSGADISSDPSFKVDCKFVYSF